MSSADNIFKPTIPPPRPGVFKLRHRNATQQPASAMKLAAQPLNSMDPTSKAENLSLLKRKTQVQALPGFQKRFSLNPSREPSEIQAQRPRVSMLNIWRRRKSSIFCEPDGQPPQKMKGSITNVLHTSEEPVVENKRIKNVFKEFRRRSSVFNHSKMYSPNLTRTTESETSNFNKDFGPELTNNTRCNLKPDELKDAIKYSVNPSLSNNDSMNDTADLNAELFSRTTVTPARTGLNEDLRSIDCEEDAMSCGFEEFGSVFTSANELDEFSDKARQMQTQIGCSLFNRNPEDGIRYLIKRELIANTPDDIALFLFNRTDLSRQAMGDYFGSVGNAEAGKVLRKYLELIDMDGMEVDEAVRAMLSHFHPAGESQKISHLMHIFQEVYIQKNVEKVASTFQRQDTVEVLAYSILMLHTDLHNPNLRRFGGRMSEESFIANNRGIDGGADIDRNILQRIYQRVADKQFRTLPDPLDVLRRLDSMLMGPGKMEALISRDRRFIGWIAAQQLDDIPTRSNVSRKRWRHILIFNDLLLIAKPVAGAPSSNGSHWSVGDCGEAELEPSRFYSTDPPARGAYHVRLVIPIEELRILVFKSQRCRNGVRFCNRSGPLINLVVPSSHVRSQLLEWTHEVVEERNGLNAYYSSKRG